AFFSLKRRSPYMPKGGMKLPSVCSRTILEKYPKPDWFHLPHYAHALFKSYEERWKAAMRLGERIPIRG
ncbi:hypothetical protein AALP_AAs56085U000100, partial [Arabis alpina]